MVITGVYNIHKKTFIYMLWKNKLNIDQAIYINTHAVFFLIMWKSSSVINVMQTDQLRGKFIHRHSIYYINRNMCPRKL